jgi:hypothetical protein
MTTVITRLYGDPKTAAEAAGRLKWNGLPANAVRVITSDGPAAGGDLDARLARAGVDPAAVPTYTRAVAAGGAALVVRATYVPLGAARITRETLAKTKSVDSGGVVEEYYVSEGPDPAPSVLKSHPRFLSLDLKPGEYKGGPISADLGIRLLSKRERKSRVYHGGRYMSKWFWPMPLLATKRSASSAIKGGAHMSKVFWPMPLLSRKERTRSVIRDGALPFSRALGMSTVTRRATDD